MGYPVGTELEQYLIKENRRLTAFVRQLLDPERYGHAVTEEIRDAARVALGKNSEDPPEDESSTEAAYRIYEQWYGK